MFFRPPRCCYSHGIPRGNINEKKITEQVLLAFLSKFTMFVMHNNNPKAINDEKKSNDFNLQFYFNYECMLILYFFNGEGK